MEPVPNLEPEFIFLTNWTGTRFSVPFMCGIGTRTKIFGKKKEKRLEPEVNQRLIGS